MKRIRQCLALLLTFLFLFLTGACATSQSLAMAGTGSSEEAAITILAGSSQNSSSSSKSSSSKDSSKSSSSKDSSGKSDASQSGSKSDSDKDRKDGEGDETSLSPEQEKFFASILEKEEYSSRDEVAAYLYLYGHLPSNYITKNEAQDLGWVSREGNLPKVAPGKSIGGDKFGNREGLLPTEKGRQYYECDIDYEGGTRNGKRIIFSNDGLIYYTEDHYESFTLLYNEDGPVSLSVTEDGEYSSKEEVAAYLHEFGHLPSNYLTKNEAQDLGWVSSKGNLWDVAPGMSIGGDTFGNREGLLPTKKGRKYYECDIDYEGGRRNAKRIIFSSDGLIYYTEDHYESFELLYGEE